MKRRVASIAMAGVLFAAAGGAIACDKEDKKDIEEVGNDVDKQVDDLDSDGKDD
jgi:hypothetical protein